jgi:hypothetical protein
VPATCGRVQAPRSQYGCCRGRDEAWRGGRAQLRAGSNRHLVRGCRHANRFLAERPTQSRVHSHHRSETATFRNRWRSVSTEFPASGRNLHCRNRPLGARLCLRDFKEGLPETSELAQRVYCEGYRTFWDEARIVAAERNGQYGVLNHTDHANPVWTSLTSGFPLSIPR